MKYKLFLTSLIGTALMLTGCTTEGLGTASSSSSRPTVQTISGPAKARDGDTIDIDGTRLDLWGIDAPNLDSSDGWYARAALDDLIARTGTLICTIKDTSGSRDDAVCSNSRSGDIGRAMLLGGWAVVSRSDTSRSNADKALANSYAQAEATARQQRAGLWGGMPRR